MTRSVFALLALLAIAPSLAAQDETASFFIESIDVRGIDRIPRDVLLYELRLPAGATYSERELREASDRINRLAYVLSADFALEKGTERGKYVLVINIKETHVFFFGADLRLYLATQGYPTNVESSNTIDTSDQGFALGWRFFVGKRGAVHFGMDGQGDNRPYTYDYSAFAAGYTQYDLFGTRAFATLNIRKPTTGGHTPLAPQVVVGMPLTPRQTLTLQYDQVRITTESAYYTYQPTTRIPYTRDIGQRLLKATWSYNTTNNPFFPTKGILVSATPLAVWADQTYVRYAPYPLPPVLRTDHRNSAGIDATATRWFEINDRDSWSAGLEGGVARTAVAYLGTTQNEDYSYAAVSASFSHSLWSREQSALRGDNRLEADIHLRVRSYDGAHDFTPYQTFADRDGNASVSWARRNTWGVWRLGLGYAW